MKFSSRVVTRRYGDFEITIGLVDAKGAAWYDYDRAFEPEIDLLRSRRLKRGALVFDLGAHQGVVALALAKCVGPEGRVIALEANPYDAAAALRNKELNSCANLTVLNAAVSDRAGSLAFATSGRVSIGDNGEPVVSVPARTIDDLAAEYGEPDVIFMDVDGYEAHALRGAQGALSSRPDLYVEVHGHLLPAYGATALEVIDSLSEQGYRLLASAEMRPSRRQFLPWAEQHVNANTPFHVVAWASPKN